MTVVIDQLFPQKPPGSRFRFSRTGVQPSPGSSTIDLPSAFAESGAYPPDRELPGSPRQCSLPLACRHPPVQPSPGSSTIDLPSAFAESGAYPPDRELPGSPRQCSLPLTCRHPPEGHQIGARKRRTPENTILSQPYCRRVSTDRPNREGSQLAASLEGEPALHPPERPSHTHTPKPGFGGRGHEM